LDIPRLYLQFLGDVPDQLAAKAAHGIVDHLRADISRPGPAGPAGQAESQHG
jgi:nicotinamide mononucleotide (NMN) deamidase PncC